MEDKFFTEISLLECDFEAFASKWEENGSKYFPSGTAISLYPFPIF